MEKWERSGTKITIRSNDDVEKLEEDAKKKVLSLSTPDQEDESTLQTDLYMYDL